MTFIPSLDLSRMLYEERIGPLMEQRFPGLPYAAATFGMCSEIFGLDDEVSMDHEWGPRVTILLSEHDHTRHSADLMAAFHEALPPTFKNIGMMWRKPGVDVHDTAEAALYHISVSTLARALKFYGGITTLPLPETDWLRVSEQHLLEFVSGAVYRDDSGELTRARNALAYYPDNVLRFLLAGEWSAAGSDWFPIGRIGSRDDRLGLRIQAAKVVQRLMRIGFMVSRRYFHYKKWFGTLFKRLPLASALEPVLLEIAEEQRWQRVEEKIGQAASLLVQEQNRLGIAPAMAWNVEADDGRRHHLKLDFWGISGQLAAHLQPPLKSLMDNQVFWLHERSLVLWNEEAGKWPLLLQA